MTNSSPQLPKFAADRALGKTVPEMLCHNGWDVTRIQDVFPDDAQDVSDSDWLLWANDHVDAALTKDIAIYRQPAYELAQLPIFCLTDQQLGFGTMAGLFLV